jgi:hypothetical protein
MMLGRVLFSDALHLVTGDVDPGEVEVKLTPVELTHPENEVFNVRRLSPMSQIGENPKW